MIPIPSQQSKKWSQTNTGEILGNIWATRNISFDTTGYAKLGKKSVALVTNGTRMKDFVSIGTLDGATYYVMTTDTGPHDKSISLLGVESSISSTNAAAGSSKFDGITWQQRWYTSQDTTFSYFDGSAWTASLGSLTTGKYHPLGVHEGLNYLAIGNGNTVLLYNSSHTLTVTLTLPSNFEVIWIRYNSNNLYIGTRNTKGGDSHLFIANGTLTTPDYSIKIPSAYYAFSGCFLDGVLVVMSSSGQLLRFNGQGFDEIARLPVFDSGYVWYNGSGFDTGRVAQRGMIAKGGKVYINLDGYIAAPSNKQLPNQPSGLWCYDPKVGLHHIASPSFNGTTALTLSNASSVTDIVTVAETFVATTGTRIFVQTTNIGGLTAGNFYYLIYLTSTTLRLATSYDNAIAGTNIDLTSNGSSFNAYVHADTSFGETLNAGYQPGAIAIIGDTNNDVNNTKGYVSSQFLWGASTINNQAGTSVYTLQTLVSGYNRGEFTTTKLLSTSLKDTWQKVYAKFDKLYQGNEKIITKYRTRNKENYPIAIMSNSTWVDSTSFTNTSTNWALAVAGDELLITSGRGAGCLVHIVSITDNAGTYTVVVDEAIPAAVVSDVSNYMIIDNWTKLNTATYTTPDGLLETPIGKSSKWLQYKIELRGLSEPYIEEMQVINEVYRQSK